MKPYALTYPQLMREILALGWSHDDLLAVRRAYVAAERMAAGIHRPSGAGFLGHLIRTTSIVVRVSPEPPLACAVLLHASYSLGRLGGLWARLTRSPPRQKLRALAGDEVEELVFRYQTLDWSDAAAVERYIRTHASCTPTERRVLMMRLANELEDLLDAGRCFTAPGFTPKQAEFARLCGRLAAALAMPQLADEIEQAIRDAASTPVAAALRSNRQLAYRPGLKWLPEALALRTRLRALTRRRRRPTSW